MRKAIKSVFHLLPLVAALWLASCRTTSVSVPATVSAPTWTFTHGPPPALLLPTLSPTRREPPTWTPTPPPTLTPVPSRSPTLGPLITRTLAPPAECPPPGNPPEIELTLYPEDAIQQIENYFDAGGRIRNLADTLGQALADMEPGGRFLSLSVADVDVTGDGIGEAVVSFNLEVQAEEGYWTEEGMGVVSVYGCRDGGFRTLMNESYITQPALLFAHLATYDLNADGVPEIMYMVENYGAHDSTTSVFIQEWDGREFRHLVVQPSEGFFFHPRSAQMPNLLSIGDLAVHSLGHGPEQQRIDSLLPDADGNGTRELILSGGVGGSYSTIGGGPGRVSIETWAWNGEAFTLAGLRFGPPEYRFQAVLDGDSAFGRGALDRALVFYQQALEDEDLLGWSDEHRRQHPYYWNGTPPVDPAERPRLTAYGQFRVMLVYAVQARSTDMGSLLESMVEEHLPGSSGYPYLELARFFHEALRQTGSVLEACRVARDFASTNAESLLDPLGGQYYGFFYDDYTPESICPVG